MKLSQHAKTLLARILLHGVIIGVMLVWLLPSVGLFVSSFRTKSQILNTGWWTAFQWPLQFTVENYQQVIETGNMGRSFVNSLMIAIPSTVMPILVAAFAAYTFSWITFPGRTPLFLFIVGLLVVPLQMTLIPILRMYNGLNLTGTFVGIWIAHAAYGLPFAIYLLRNFIGELPKEMLECAFIDGASHYDVFFKLVLPTSVPAIASLSIFQFMWVWNDLLIALVYLGGTPKVAPMTVTIGNLVNSYGAGWHLLTSAAFISMMLPMIVFFALQQYFVKGILAGSVKG